jgi:hypothetical protein
MINFKQIKKEVDNFERLFNKNKNDDEKLCIVLQSYIKNNELFNNFLKDQINILVTRLEDKCIKEIQK